MLKDKTDDITKTINLHFDSSAVTTISNYRYTSLCETSSVAGQCQAKLVSDW